MQRNKILENARLAGGVRRYHTWPMLNQAQTVADHSYHCMRIWWTIWGPMPPEISTYFLWHDAGELVLGDLPYPVKAHNDKLKAACDEIEEAALVRMGGIIPNLSADDKRRVKLCDLIEMFELGLHERAMGNSFATPIVHDIYESICGMVTTEDWDKIHAYFCATGALPWK